MASPGAAALRLLAIARAARSIARPPGSCPRRHRAIVVAGLDARRVSRPVALPLSPVRHRDGALVWPRSHRRMARRGAPGADRQPAIARSASLHGRDRPRDLGPWGAAM